VRRAVLLGVGAAAVLSATIPADSVPINIEWRANLAGGTREALEQRFQLVDGQPLGGSTWRYRLQEYSREHLRALVTDAAIADTHFINRSTFEPDDPPVRRIVFVLAGSLLIAILGAAGLSEAPLTLGAPALTLAVAAGPFVLFVLGVLILVTTSVTGEWPWADW